LDPNVALFANFLRRVLPPDVASEAAEQLASMMGNVFSSPVTTMHQISEFLDKTIAGANMAAIKREFLWDFPNFWLEWANAQVTADEEKLRHVARCDAARELMNVLFDMYSEAGVQSPFAATFQSCLSSIDALKPAAALGKIFDVPNADKIEFERRTRLTAATIGDLAECFYKPYLQTCLALTRIHAGQDGAAPSTLGAVIGECRDAWKDRWAVLLPLLSQEACIIRNSESHSNTRFDPVARTVTFVNTRSNGEEQLLGPLTDAEYEVLGQRIESEFLALQAALECTFRRMWMMHQAAS